MKIFKLQDWTIHGGTGYNTGDGMDIESRVLTIFGINIFISTKVSTKDNVYTMGLFGYEWINKKRLDNNS